jgi:hypothetical protein
MGFDPREALRIMDFQRFGFIGEGCRLSLGMTAGKHYYTISILYERALILTIAIRLDTPLRWWYNPSLV